MRHHRVEFIQCQHEDHSQAWTVLATMKNLAEIIDLALGKGEILELAQVFPDHRGIQTES